MTTKTSSSLITNYISISNMAKESKEPIYITKYGEVDLVAMSDLFEKREQLLELRDKVLCVESERLNLGKNLSVFDARILLNERINEN